MNKTLAYIRVSTENQEANNQRLEILEFARKQNIKVDEFIEITVSSRKNTKDRRIDELLARLAENDALIVTEISRLGRSTSEVIQLINRLIENNVRIIVLKQGLDISRQDMQSKIIVTLFSLFAELERDLVSLRTKEALAAKKSQGILLGKPKGTIQKSKFDADRERIEELLKLGLSVRKIAKLLNYPNHIGLNTYVRKRGMG
jgi:DNA invertase Pin-like site-specific DNA recombinase